MPRKARDDRLDTRTARLKLTPRREPYWRTIQEGRALGYRRLAGGKAGTWIARHYSPTEGRQYAAIGSADDMLNADNGTTLSFGQAQERARAWFLEIERGAGRAVTPITVSEALDHYVTDYLARGGKALPAMQATIEGHIRPALGERKVAELTSAHIRAWLRLLAEAPARLRTRATANKRRVRLVEADDADGRRARRATANRVLTVLKAALNLAYRDQRVPSDDAWRRVQPFQRVDTPRVRYLSDEECSRLVSACPRALQELVTAALLTGCRYNELATLRHADLDLDTGVLHVRASKSGQARAVVLTDEARRFFGQAAAGKDRHAILLPREDGQPWGKSHQHRPLRQACRVAKITPAVSFHICRHTHASRLATKGVPMAVIAAQLGHSDIKITSRHYGHLSPGYVADAIRTAFGDLGFVPDKTVTAMRRGC